MSTEVEQSELCKETFLYSCSKHTEVLEENVPAQYAHLPSEPHTSSFPGHVLPSVESEHTHIELRVFSRVGEKGRLLPCAVGWF